LSAVDSSDIPDELQQYFQNIGGIEGNSGNEGYSSEVSGAISLAGAIHSLSFFDADDEPIVSIHSTDDNTVSYECDNALGNSAFPVLCGSGEIHNTLDALEITNSLLTLNNGDHAAPIADLNQTSIPFIQNFLYNIVCGSVSVNDQLPIQTKIYPNPANEVLNIESNRPYDKVVIFDNFGRKVLELEINNSQSKIAIDNLKEGLYHLQLFNNSEQINCESIVKIN